MFVIALFLLLNRYVVSFTFSDVSNPSLSEELSKSLSSLSFDHHMINNYNLNEMWRGKISLFNEYETNLASSSQTESENTSENNRKLSEPSFSCVKLSSGYDPYLMCSDVVDYSFYLPTGKTIDDLEETVRASVPAAFGLMTGSCLSDYKKMICARIFPPCVEGVVPDDKSTYINGLPYQKPCSSLCTSASSSGTTCGGFLEAIGITMDCSDSSIYDTGSATDSSVCNALSRWDGKQVVSDRVEKYSGNVCKGVIDQVYMFDPNMTAGVPGLPDLMPPGEHQKILESTVAVLSIVPRWLKSDCLTDMRKIFCAATFPQPVATEALKPYGFGTCYLGRFAHYSLCSKYLDTCGVALNAFFADYSSMHLDCNATVPGTLGTVRVFPDESQVLAAVAVTNTTTVYLSSDPTYTVASDYYNISSQCPYGFSDISKTPVEQQPYTITMLPDTPTVSDCIFTCPTKYFTQEDRTKLLTANQVCSILTLPTVLWAIFCWIMWYTKEGKLPMGYESGPSLAIFSFAYILSSFAFNKPNQPTCATDTVWFRIDSLDKEFSGSAGYICSFRAYADLLICFILFYSFGNTSIELFLRVVRKWTDNDIKPFKKIWDPLNFSLHHIFPLIAFSLAGYGLSGEEKQGYSGIAKVHGHNTYCSFTTGNDSLDFSLLFMPIVISYFVFMIPYVYTLVYAIFISYRAFSMQGENTFGKLWRTYKSLILLGLGTGIWASNLIFNFFFGYYAGSSINVFENWDGLLTAVTDYYGCIVGGFTSLDADPSGGADRCSIVDIQKRLPVGNGITTTVMIIIYAISLIATSTNKHAIQFVWNLLPAQFQDKILAFSSKNEAKVIPLDNIDKKAELKSLDTDVELAVKCKPKEPSDPPRPPLAHDEETKTLE